MRECVSGLRRRRELSCYIYVYAPELGKGFLSSSVYRRDKNISVALPDDYAGRELHAWLMTKADDGRWSDSAYCGELVEDSDEPVVDSAELSVDAVGQVVSSCVSRQPQEHTPPDDTGQINLNNQ